MKILFRIVFIFLPLLSIGQQRWEVEYGNDDIWEAPMAIVKSYDNATTICGVNQLKNGFLFKTGVNGELLWHKTLIGDSPFYQAMDADLLGNHVLAGNSYAYACISYFNNCGDLIWCNYYQYNDQAEFLDVLILDNSILACCEVHDEEYCYIAKLLNFNFDGDLLWVKDVAGPALDSMIMEPIPFFF